MSIASALRRAPLRVATGAYILNSGLGKLKADDETATGVHGMATNAYPVFNKMAPKSFVTLLGVGETTLGAVLLLPLVPAGLAGLGLLGFAGALLGVYGRTEGVHDKYFRPQGAGSGLAKDIWMAGSGLALVLDALSQRGERAKTKIG